MPSWYKIKKIYVGQSRVRPSWWQPWANTVFYFPFHKDILDETWNYTWNSWACSFSNNMATVTTELRDTPSRFGSHTTPYTILAWVKMTTGNENWFMFKTDGGYNPALAISSRYTGSTSSNQWVWISIYHSWWYYKTKVWWNGEIHHVAWVGESSGLKVYIDGAYFNTISYATPAGGSSWDGMGARVWSTFWDVILESKARTAQEILNYYNQTKWTYWL